MAVVTGHVGRVVTHHCARLDDEVFENLVHCRAEVNVGVGIGRSIVKNENC